MSNKKGKRKFISTHWNLFLNYKFGTREEGKVSRDTIISLARERLGYSDNTVGQDIISSLSSKFEDMVAEMKLNVEYDMPEEWLGTRPGPCQRNINSEMAKCVEFLIKNGWQPREIGGNVYSMNKPGHISVDLVKDEGSMAFIGESGDFLHRPIDKYTLIGVLLEHRQLPINYKS